MKKLFLSIIITTLLLTFSLTVYIKIIFPKQELLKLINSHTINHSISAEIKDISVSIFKGITLKNVTVKKYIKNTNYSILGQIPSIYINYNLFKSIQSKNIIWNNIKVSSPIFKIESKITTSPEKNIKNNTLPTKKNKLLNFSDFSNKLNKKVYSILSDSIKNMSSKTKILPINISKASLFFNNEQILSNISGKTIINLKYNSLQSNLRGTFKNQAILISNKTISLNKPEPLFKLSIKTKGILLDSSCSFNKTLLKISSLSYKNNNSKAFLRGSFDLKDTSFNIDSFSILNPEQKNIISYILPKNIDLLAPINATLKSTGNLNQPETWKHEGFINCKNIVLNKTINLTYFSSKILTVNKETKLTDAIFNSFGIPALTGDITINNNKEIKTFAILSAKNIKIKDYKNLKTFQKSLLDNNILKENETFTLKLKTYLTKNQLYFNELQLFNDNFFINSSGILSVNKHSDFRLILNKQKQQYVYLVFGSPNNPNVILKSKPEELIKQIVKIPKKKRKKRKRKRR
jgi:hypothetical protein